MAENVLFEVDAAQILAKLHLAGLQATRHLVEKDAFIVNTGVLKDNPNAKPENPGDVSFDLKNTSGEYEVGYVTWIEYSKTYQLDDVFSKLQKLMADIASSKIDAKSTDPKMKDLQKQLDEQKKKARQLAGFKDDAPLDTTEQVKDAKKAADEKVKNESTDYDKVQSSKMDLAVEILKTYLDNFVGADNVTSFNKATMIPVSEKAKDSNDKALVKMYEIQQAPEQELEKLIAQFKANMLKDPGKPNCRQHICFKVQYHLNVDK